MNEKHQFIIPAAILVSIVGLMAAYGFIQAQYGLGPGGTLSVTSASVIGNTTLGDESTDVVTINGSITATGGALLNSAGANTGLRVEDGNSNAVLLVGKTGDMSVSGTISATEMKIGTQNVCRADGTNCLSASHGKQRFTANGTFTVPAGVTKVWVSMSGGGGGGSSGKKAGDGTIVYEGGGGGGAHAVLAQEVTVVSGENIAITVGVGGAGGSGTTVVPNGTGGDDGGDGGTSLFGGYISTSGGKGNTNNWYSSTSGTSGGSGGTRGSLYRILVDDKNGCGGGSIFGAGGCLAHLISDATTFQGTPGDPGSGFGGGGGGGRPNQHTSMKGGPSGNGTLGGAGGAGAPGFVLVEW